MSVKEDSFGNQFAEVYNDLVRIRDLAIANVLGIFCGISFFVLSRYLMLHGELTDPEKIKGYALFFGILGCLLSGILSARWFKAKRELTTGDTICFNDALVEMGVDPEEEMAAIRASSSENKKELYELGILGKLSPKNAVDGVARRRKP
jgi:hypothetical protein